MDARISPLSSQALNPAAGLQMRRAAPSGGPGGAGGVAGGFSDNFRSALKSVSAAQNEATRLQTEVQLGNPNVSLEETMLAMQKAQIGFQATLNVRNRMVQAYTDIMNMSV
jgi:flagellar hook-basal body complex protein FliE